MWKVNDLDSLLALGCNHLDSYFISHPIELESLSFCHTPARKLAAAPTLVEQGDKLATQGRIVLAVARYQTALDWGLNPPINPIQRAQRLATENKSDTAGTSQ